MSGRDWLRRQTTARPVHPTALPASDGLASFVAVFGDTAVQEPASAPVGAVMAQPAPEAAPALRNADADAAARTALHGELDRRKLRDGLERCGCWPRYIGGCYCPTGGNRG